MFGNTRERIGISFVDDCLKIVQVRISPAEKRVTGVVKKDVRGTAEGEIPKIIRGLLSELGVKKPSAVFALSSSAVTTKNIEVPSIDPAEIKSIIDLQAGRHTPYSREEILIGYVNVGIFQKNYTKVLLVIVNRDQLLKQLRGFIEAGVRVEKVVFAPEATALFYAQVLKHKEGDKPVGIIDISRQATEFVVTWNRTVVTSRNLPVGMDALIKEGQPAQDKLIAELLKSIEVYQSEDIGPLPEQYLLTGDDAKLKDLQPVLQDKLKTAMGLSPYLDHITAAQPIILRIVSEYNDDSFLSVIAAGINFDEMRLDMTPEEILTQRQIEEKGKLVIFAAINGLIIFVLFCAIVSSKIYFREMYLNKLKADLEDKQKVVTVLDSVAQKTQILKDYTADRMMSLNIVRSLYKLVPEDMYLQSINLEENGTINIQGVSDSMSLVFNLVTSLGNYPQDNPLFKDVNLKSTSTKQERGKEVAVFEITMKLVSAPDEENKDKSENKGEKKNGADKATDKPAKGKNGEAKSKT